MSDIDEMAVFIKERLGEDEEAARESLHGSRGEWAQRSEDADLPQGHLYDDSGEVVVYDEGRPTGWQFDHIASHDPARVLREVEAKRAIIAVHAQLNDSIWCQTCDPGAEPFGDSHACYPCRTLRLLAAIWSEHPDYQATWKP